MTETEFNLRESIQFLEHELEEKMFMKVRVSLTILNEKFNFPVDNRSYVAALMMSLSSMDEGIICKGKQLMETELGKAMTTVNHSDIEEILVKLEGEKGIKE